MSSLSGPEAVPAYFKKVLKILAKPEFEQGIAIERQVAAHVKELIESGKLEANTRLPPIRTLAELWNTNYFTVQAALRRVFSEGLLVQSPKLGTFVAAEERIFRRACLYHDHDLSFAAQEEFYSKLNIWLYRILAERGIQIITHFDHRDRAEIGTAPKEIRNLVRERRIDAIIASGIAHENTAWLTKLGIPFAAFSVAQKHGGIIMDYEGFAKKAIDVIAKAGKRSVGLIYRPKPYRTEGGKKTGIDLSHYVSRAAQEAGLKVLLPEESLLSSRFPSFEGAGYHLCESLLLAKERPEALLIYPDVYTRGVVSAILKHDINVPEDMVVVSHRNADAAFFTPFPVVWLTVQIEDFARGLVDQIDNQFAGKKPKPVIITAKVETDARKFPARPRRPKKGT